ncbi:hypothetical protein Zm00014a_028606 [Zea mays]|uniref:Uncharacterized protein n=1 Tax=Zea mays TaxID=4577 RepID=A0A3L6DD38_MAIZE|nr:hypothetical protein Zm00014a_028606 [Zea mays]
MPSQLRCDAGLEHADAPDMPHRALFW